MTTAAPINQVWIDIMSHFLKVITSLQNLHDNSYSKPFKCEICDYSCSRNLTWKDMLSQFMGIVSHSNVKNVTTSATINQVWRIMLSQFMRKRNHSYVQFVTTVGPKNLIWKDMLSQFMGTRSHSNVKYVTTVVPKSLSLYILHIDSVQGNNKPFKWLQLLP